MPMPTTTTHGPWTDGTARPTQKGAVAYAKGDRLTIEDEYTVTMGRGERPLGFVINAADGSTYPATVAGIPGRGAPHPDYPCFTCVSVRWTQPDRESLVWTAVAAYSYVPSKSSSTALTGNVRSVAFSHNSVTVPLTMHDGAALTTSAGELLNPTPMAELSSPVIVGEHTYLAAKVKRERNYEIAFGYSFEKACLYAKSLGIGTVMLAASLSRSTFEEAMNVQEDEVLPTASPVGYPAEKRSIRENLMRKGMKSDERIAFGELFFEGSFDKPLTEEAAGDYAQALEMARLSPSATNKQPWGAVVDGSRVHFYEQKSLKDSSLGDIQKVDVGIALCHFDLVMEENGSSGRFLFCMLPSSIVCGFPPNNSVFPRK